MLNEEFSAYEGQQNFKMKVVAGTRFDLTITAMWLFQGKPLSKDDANFEMIKTPLNKKILFQLKIRDVSKKVAGTYSVKIKAKGF